MKSTKCIFNYALVIALLLIVTVRVFGNETEISPDSPRYISLGLNLYEHGVLTGAGYREDSAPEPGLGMAGAFTAFEIALAAGLHEPTHDNLKCLANTSLAHQTCKTDVPSLRAIYVLELLIFHLCVFSIARTVFASDIKAWIAVAVSLGFKESHEYVRSILSEPASFMALGLFLLFWLQALRQPHTLRSWLFCGVALGLLSLVKPAWVAAAPALAVLIFLSAMLRREEARNTIRAALVFASGFAVLTAPLFIRNAVQLDLWGMSDPAYLVASLSHRFAYNAMSWGEWLAGWLYYLPDFGDNAARSAFGEPMIAKLDWGPDSYYVFGRDVLHKMALSKGEIEQAKAFLLENHFFNDPVKSFAVTALLAWRGLFVGNLVGLAAAVLALPVLYFAKGTVRRDILGLCVPLIIMVGVNALVSVSIHRYNIGLIVPFSLILTQSVHAIGQWGHRHMHALGTHKLGMRKN